MCFSQQISLPVVPNPQLLWTGLLLPVPVGLPRVHLLRAAESRDPADRMQGERPSSHLLPPANEKVLTLSSCRPARLSLHLWLIGGMSPKAEQGFAPHLVGGLLMGQVRRDSLWCNTTKKWPWKVCQGFRMIDESFSQAPPTSCVLKNLHRGPCWEMSRWKLLWDVEVVSCLICTLKCACFHPRTKNNPMSC